MSNYNNNSIINNRANGFEVGNKVFLSCYRRVAHKKKLEKRSVHALAHTDMILKRLQTYMLFLSNM